MISGVYRKRKPGCWNRELGDGVADFLSREVYSGRREWQVLRPWGGKELGVL